MNVYHGLLIAVGCGVVAGVIAAFCVRPAAGIVLGCVAAAGVFQALMKMKAYGNITNDRRRE